MSEPTNAKESQTSAMSEPEPSAVPNEPSELAGFRVDISHQEVERILSEVEAYWTVVKESGGEWVVLDAMRNLIINDLGYEDEDELNDALHGTLEEFLAQFPHIKTRVREEDGRLALQLIPPPPPEQRRATKYTLEMRERTDLFRVCLKSVDAKIEIPEFEFEIGSDGKRQIDTIYNHLARAMFHLENIVSQSSHYGSEERARIAETNEQLSQALDLALPWTFVVTDPSGLSDFKPAEGVKKEYL